MSTSKTGIIDSYSAFFDNGHRQKTELDGWLRGQGIVELTVLGLATDYCVKFTVLDALALGYAVNVITDGCRGVNLQPQDSSQAFMEMAAAGATLYTLDAGGNSGLIPPPRPPRAGSSSAASLLSIN